MLRLALIYAAVVAIPASAADLSREPVREPRYGQGCECPYDRAKDGSRCGARSAYSKPGGRAPVCYTDES